MNSAGKQAGRVARNFTWLALQEILIRVIGLGTAVYLARTLSPASYGALGLALAIVSMAGTFVVVGTGSRAMRQTALDPAAVPTIYAQLTGFRLAAAAAAILLLVILAPLLSGALSFSTTLLILCAGLLVGYALSVRWAFRGLDRMHVTASAEIIEKILLLLGLLLLVRGQGQDVLWAPVVELVAGLLVVVWLRSRLGRDYPGLKIGFPVREWPDIAREAMPLSLGALMFSFSQHGSVLLVGWLSTAASAAGFLVAQKIMLTLSLLSMVISGAAFPSTIRLLAGNTAGALAMQANLLRYCLVIIVPAFLLVVLYAEELLVLLFGADYASAADALVILLVALPFLALNSCLSLLLRAIPKPGGILATRVVGAGVLVLLAVIAIPRLGLSGAALAVVGADMACSVMLLVLVKLATGHLPLNARCLGPFGAGALATLGYWMADETSVIARLAVSAGLYAVAILLTRALTLIELRSLPGLVLHIVREPVLREPAE